MLATLYGYLQTLADPVVQEVLVKIFATALLLACGYALRPVRRFLTNLFFTNIHLYEGKYHGYRWASETRLIRPEILIQKKWTLGRWFGKDWRFGDTVLIWITPDGDSSTFPLVEFGGREIYAHGLNSRIATYSYFVIHPTYAKSVNFMSGMYMFMNNSHEVVSGPFLLSREALTEEKITELMPPQVIYSSQVIAASRLYKAQEFGRADGNVVPLVPMTLPGRPPAEN